MPQIGPLEIIVLAVIALLVFGPEKLPGMAKTLGKGIKQAKGMAAAVKSEFDVSFNEDAEKPAPKKADGPATVEAVEPPDEDAVVLASEEPVTATAESVGTR